MENYNNNNDNLNNTSYNDYNPSQMQMQLQQPQPLQKYKAPIWVLCVFLLIGVVLNSGISTAMPLVSEALYANNSYNVFLNYTVSNVQSILSFAINLLFAFLGLKIFNSKCVKNGHSELVLKLPYLAVILLSQRIAGCLNNILNAITSVIFSFFYTSISYRSYSLITIGFNTITAFVAAPIITYVLFSMIIKRKSNS